MQVRIDGRGTSKVHDCEDVTVTYYTENTIAFKDAHDKWKQRVDDLRHTLSTLNQRAQGIQSRLDTAVSRAQRAEWGLVKYANRGVLYHLRSRVKDVLGLPDPVAALKKEAKDNRRTEQIERESLAELAQRIETTRSNLDALIADEITPGIELSLRGRDRQQILFYLPQNGNVAYVMNDRGKTVARFAWPMETASSAGVPSKKEQKAQSV